MLKHRKPNTVSFEAEPLLAFQFVTSDLLWQGVDTEREHRALPS